MFDPPYCIRVLYLDNVTLRHSEGAERLRHVLSEGEGNLAKRPSGEIPSFSFAQDMPPCGCRNDVKGTLSFEM